MGFRLRAPADYVPPTVTPRDDGVYGCLAPVMSRAMALIRTRTLI